MAVPLTKVANFPDKAVVKPGMAYFAGTGPKGKCCRDCTHRGYWRTSASREDYRTTACIMFKTLTGVHGPRVDADWAACKYFKQKPKRDYRR
jgi:hypothetical protein